MKNFLKIARRYITTMCLADMASLKLCMLSLGVIIGLALAGDTHRAAFTLSLIVFIATYIPAMWRFFKFMRHGEK